MKKIFFALTILPFILFATDINPEYLKNQDSTCQVDNNSTCEVK